MNKLLCLSLAGIMLLSCSTKKTTTDTANSSNHIEIKQNHNVQYLDDFTSASPAVKETLLKELRAEEAKYSVVILTQNYKGEKIIIKNSKRKLYDDYTISNLKSKLAREVRIDNTLDTTVYDNLTKTMITIEAKEAQKHKFIYIKKNPGSKNIFTITYSNTLRPLQ